MAAEGDIEISRDPRVKQLVAAARRGDVKTVKRLLDGGTDPNALPELGSGTAFWTAIYNNRVDVIRAMAGSKADFNDGWPDTPLTAAAGRKGLDMIRALVEGGADVNLPSSSGHTPLMEAVVQNRPEVAAELVRLGADPNLIPKKKKGQESVKLSPLQWAASDGNKKMVAAIRAAMPAGGAAGAGGKADKRLLIMELCGAAIRGNLTEVKRLVEREGVDVNAKDGDGTTPLVSAVSGGNPKVVRYLLDRGADANRVAGKRSGGLSALIEAARLGDVEVLRMLVEAGADLGYAPKRFPQATALAVAKEARSKRAAEYLLEAERRRGSGGGGEKTSKGRAEAIKGPRGVTTFDTNDAVVLVAAGVADVSRAFARRLGAKKRYENVLGDEVKLARRCYAVWKLTDSPWTVVMKLRCADFRHWPGVEDAVALSKSLKTRALYVANSDTGGATQYALFDRGEPVEVFSYNGNTRDDAAADLAEMAEVFGVDLATLGNVSAGDGKFFASAARKVDVRKIRNDLDFVNDFAKRQEAFVPFWPEEWGEPGEHVELTLEGLGPDDVERLDYVAAR